MGAEYFLNPAKNPAWNGEDNIEILFDGDGEPCLTHVSRKEIGLSKSTAYVIVGVSRIGFIQIRDLIDHAGTKARRHNFRQFLLDNKLITN